MNTVIGNKNSKPDRISHWNNSTVVLDENVASEIQFINSVNYGTAWESMLQYSYVYII